MRVITAKRECTFITFLSSLVIVSCKFCVAGVLLFEVVVNNSRVHNEHLMTVQLSIERLIQSQTMPTGCLEFESRLLCR